MTTKDITTFAPTLEMREMDHTLVVGWEWNWSIVMPPDFFCQLYSSGDGAMPSFAGWAYRNEAERDPLCQFALSLTRTAQYIGGALACHLSGAQTAMLTGTPLHYAVHMQMNGVESRIAQGRIDLMTPDEYYKSIRRVKYKIEIANPWRKQ